ncbi:20145_t:CDS:2, partial [Racocetra persica]
FHFESFQEFRVNCASWFFPDCTQDIRYSVQHNADNTSNYFAEYLPHKPRNLRQTENFPFFISTNDSTYNSLITLTVSDFTSFPPNYDDTTFYYIESEIQTVPVTQNSDNLKDPQFSNLAILNIHPSTSMVEIEKEQKNRNMADIIGTVAAIYTVMLAFYLFLFEKPIAEPFGFIYWLRGKELPALPTFQTPPISPSTPTSPTRSSSDLITKHA